MNIPLLIALSSLIQVPAQDGAIRATFVKDNITLTLSARCGPSDILCPFTAEIDAPSALFQLIEGVDYTYVPDRRTSPAPVTDAATHFYFEGKQTFGEKVWAEIRIKRSGDAAARTILVDGAIPFAAEVTPKLPSGLRFEDKYWEQFLEGGVSIGYYLFRIVLLGDAKARARIRSVEYRLPAAQFSPARFVAHAESEYLLENSAPKDPKWNIVAVIRWRDGASSTHALPFRPR